MAYFNLLASVAESEVERFRADPSTLLRSSLVLGASHLLAYWVEGEPLAGLLWQALDGERCCILASGTPSDRPSSVRLGRCWNSRSVPTPHGERPWRGNRPSMPIGWQ